MPRVLVVLTSLFPLGPGEPFFAEELAQIHQAFERVILVPTAARVDASARPVCSLPERCSVIPLPLAEGKARWAALARLPADALGDLASEARRCTTLAHWRVLLAFVARGTDLRRRLAAALQAERLKARELTLYSYWLDEGSYAIATYRRRHRATRAFSRAHAWDVYEERHDPPYLPLRDAILRGLDRTLAVSSSARDALLKASSVAAAAIEVRYLGTRAGRPRVSPRLPGRLRILTLAFVTPIKQLELLVDALARLPDIPVEWHHVGGGPGEAALQDRARRGLGPPGSSVAHFHGTKTAEQLRDFLDATDLDLLVSCSRHEGLPVSMMEACSYAIPILAPAVGGVGEIVHDGENGFLLPAPLRVEELALALRRAAMTPPARWIALREAALQTWSQRFRADVNYPALAHVLAGS